MRRLTGFTRASCLALVAACTLFIPRSTHAQSLRQSLMRAGEMGVGSAVPTHVDEPRTAGYAGGVVIVPLHTPGDRPIVSAMINGRGPFLLGIETGSSAALLLFTHTMAELGLNGRNRGDSQFVDSLAVGGLTMYAIQMVVAGDSPLPTQLDGLLGLGAFAKLTVELDIPGGRALFTADTLPASNGKDVLPLIRAGDIFAVTARAGNRPLTLALDSQGGVGLALRSSAAEALSLASPFVQVGMLTGPAIGVIARRAARASGNVTLGQYAFEQPMLVADAIPDKLAADGIIGMHALSAFSVALDQRTGRVRFSRSDSVIAAPSSLFGHGIALRYEGERVHVATVMPISPAAAATLRAGDTILQINGQSTHGFSPADWQPLSESVAPLVLLVQREEKTFTVTLPAVLLIR